MVKGQAVKTKSDPNINGGSYFVYDKPNGNYLGAFPTSNVIGFFVEEKTVNSVTWTYVKLLRPLKNKYSYCWIVSEKVFAWTPKTDYVIATGRTGVNVRNAPSLTSGVIKKLNAGQSVGKTDGFSLGDFYLFNLTGGGYGWVSKIYVQVANTQTGGNNPPTDGTTVPTGTDQLPLPKGNPITQYAGYAVIFFSCILLITLVRYGIKFAK